MRAINVFRPDAARAMGHAFDDVCASLQIPNTAIKAREMIAKRIIERGSQGEHEYTHLHDRVLNEANYRKYRQTSGHVPNGPRDSVLGQNAAGSMAAGARGYFVGHRSAAVGFQGTITRAAASTHAYRFELCLIDSWRAHLRDRDATALRKIKPYASE